jgi:hypothetical protein
MKTFSTAATDALSSGAFWKARFFRFHWGVNYGFWDGDTDITPTGSNIDADALNFTFKAGGSLIEFQHDQVGLDASAPKFTMRLRAIRDTALSPDVLGTIRSQPYHRKRVSVFHGLLNNADRSIIHIVLFARGYIDEIPMFREPDGDGNMQAYLQGSVENNIIEWNRRGAHDRNDESQRLTFPGDKGLSNRDRTSKALKWAKGVSQSS